MKVYYFRLTYKITYYYMANSEKTVQCNAGLVYYAVKIS